MIEKYFIARKRKLAGIPKPLLAICTILVFSLIEVFDYLFEYKYSQFILSIIPMFLSVVYYYINET